MATSIDRARELTAGPRRARISDPLATTRLPMENRPSFRELLPDGYRMGNEIVGLSYYLAERAMRAPPEPDFDPFAAPLPKELEVLRPHLVRTRSRAEFTHRLHSLLDEAEHSQRLADGGLAGFGALGVAALTSPLTLLGGSAALTKVDRIRQGVAIGAGAAALQEAGIAAGQAGYDPAQAGLSVAAGAFLGGVGSAIGRQLPREALEASEAEMRAWALHMETGRETRSTRPFELTEEEWDASNGRAQRTPEEEAILRMSREEYAEWLRTEGPARPTARAPRPFAQDAATGQERPIPADLGDTRARESDMDGPFRQTGTLGAAARRGTLLMEEELRDLDALKGALGLEKIPINPFVRLMNAKVDGVRENAWALVEAPGFYQVKNALGIASEQSVETRARRWSTGAWEAESFTEAAFVRMRQGDPGRPLRERARIAFNDSFQMDDGVERLSYGEFRHEVGRALNQGDQHRIPEVAEAAREWRSKVFEPMRQEAEELGVFRKSKEREAASARSEMEDLDFFMKLLDRDEGRLNTAQQQALNIEINERTTRGRATGDRRGRDRAGVENEMRRMQARLAQLEEELQMAGAGLTERRNGSYFPRMWRIDKIVDNEEAFKDILRNYFRRRMGYAGDTLEQSVKRTLEVILREEPWYRVNDNPDVTGRASAMHTRFLDFDFEEIADYLELDVAAVGRLYARTMGTDLELTRRFGSVEMTEQIDEIDNWMVEQVRELRDTWAQAHGQGERGTLLPEHAEELRAAERLVRKHAEDAKRDLRGLRDRLRGTYGLPEDPWRPLSRAYRMVKQFNAMTMLGMSAISSIPDVMRPVMVEGMDRTFRHGLRPLWENWQKASLARRELRLASVGLDVLLNTRAFQFADISDTFGRRGSIDRMMTDATGRFFLLNGLNHWTAAMKQWTGLIVSARVIDSARRLTRGTIEAPDLERLARSGIDEDMARRIADQFDQYGEIEQGTLYLPNTGDWDDLDALWAYRNAVAMDVNRIIVTPGAADRPLWMSTELGSVIGQFKTFGVSAMQRVLVAGLQDPHRGAFLYGAAMLVAMGGVSNELRDKVRGGRGYHARSWREELVDAVDRSGVLGWFMDVANILEVTSENRLGIRPAIGAPRGYTASPGFKFGTVAGPTGSTIANAAELLRATFSQDFDYSTARALRMSIPGNNLWFATQAFDGVQDELRGYSRRAAPSQPPTSGASSPPR